MTIPIIFWALTLIACLHASIFGGPSGRRGSTLFVATAAASYVAEYCVRSGDAWLKVNVLLCLVDAAYLIGLYVLALLSRRFWPIWAAGFQLTSTMTHVAAEISPAAPHIYRALESVWAIPILLAMMVGIELDRRSGI